MNKTAISITIVIALAALLGWYLYLQNNRYDLVSSGKGLAYEVDHKKGTTWVILPSKKTILNEPTLHEQTAKSVTFPPEEQAKVTGNAGLAWDSFSGKLYNGSDWTVRELVFLVTVKEKTGEVRWTRRLRENVVVLPLTTSDFSVMVAGAQDAGPLNWTILDVYGVPPN